MGTSIRAGFSHQLYNDAAEKANKSSFLVNHLAQGGTNNV